MLEMENFAILTSLNVLEKQVLQKEQSVHIQPRNNSQNLEVPPSGATASRIFFFCVAEIILSPASNRVFRWQKQSSKKTNGITF